MSRWRACQVNGCLRRSRTHGLCDAHAKRLKITGKLQEELPVRSLTNKRYFVKR
jgi:hypothetical protein